MFCAKRNTLEHRIWPDPTIVGHLVRRLACGRGPPAKFRVVAANMNPPSRPLWQKIGDINNRRFSMSDRPWRPTGGKDSLLEARLNTGMWNGKPIYIHVTS